MASEIKTSFATISQYHPLFVDTNEYYNSRYKVFYGGRYSAKSTQAGMGLLVRGHKKEELILCTREVQKSIDDSVKRLLEQQVSALKLGYFYTVRNTYIKGKNGTEFIFEGLKDHTVESIKSKEGVTICWVEEANTVSARSWSILIPTIRKNGSEIWITFNPDQEADYSYSQFVMRRRPDAYVCKVNYTDLPDSWLTDAIKSEIAYLKENDYEEYVHVYGGECRTYSDELIIQPAKLRRAFMALPVSNYPDTPISWGLDPARLGGDKIKIAEREGRNVNYIEEFPKGRIDETSARLMDKIEKNNPDRCFVDAGGLGVGVYDNCIGNGYDEYVTKIDFGGSPLNPDRHKNKRAEMYEAFADWLDDEPNSIQCTPKVQDQLIQEATAIKKVWEKNKILGLTPKEQVKKEYGFSPDNLDALVLTFAERIKKRKAKAKAISTVSGWMG